MRLARDRHLLHHHDGRKALIESISLCLSIHQPCPGFRDVDRESVLEEIIADLIGLRGGALVLRQPCDHCDKCEVGEYPSLRRRQRSFIDSYLVDPAVEPILWPAACANPKRLPLHSALAVEIIEENLQLLILAIDVDLHAARPAR